MGLETFVIDPSAEALTPDEVVAKVNAATSDITRASSVTAAARPIEALEVDTAELAAGAVTNPKIGALAVDSAELAADAVTEAKIEALAVSSGKIAIDAISGSRARATETLTLTGQPLDTETVTVGGKTYTFQTVLTDVDGNVLIGAAETDSLDNLIAAINLGAGSGTVYAAATTEQTEVDAVAGAGETMDVAAVVGGTAGNAIATTHTLSNGSFGAANLSGGTDAVMVEHAARDSLDSDGRKTRRYVKSVPVAASGDFTAIALKRTAGGLFEVEYDGIAV